MYIYKTNKTKKKKLVTIQGFAAGFLAQLWLILSSWLKASLRIQENSFLAHKMKYIDFILFFYFFGKVCLWWWEYFPFRTTSHFSFYVLVPGLKVAESCCALTFGLFWECTQDCAPHYMIHLTFLC